MKSGRALIVVCCVLGGGLTAYFGTIQLMGYGSMAGHTVPLKEPVPAYIRSLRPNYPYSIIAGGAYSPAELRYADQEDPVVKKHYEDFDIKDAQMVQLTDDRYQYASYRVKQKVYWTKKRLRIPKGEVLLTDGNSWARARCGNRLSDKPHPLQVSNEEPSAKALSIPPMHLGEPMQLAENPALGELSAVRPINEDRFQPVLPPPSNVATPPGLQPLTPAPPIVPIVPVIPPIFSPPGTPTPPGTPVTPNPPVIPPDNPPVTPVPEPSAIYLFLVTFILSLYGLSRMMPPAEKEETGKAEHQQT